MADTVAYQEVIDRENNPIKYAMKKAGLNIKKLSLLLDAPYRTVQGDTAIFMPLLHQISRRALCAGRS